MALVERTVWGAIINGQELRLVDSSGNQVAPIEKESIDTSPKGLRRAYEQGQKSALAHAKRAFDAARNPQKP